jgi:hypothetical protein
MLEKSYNRRFGRDTDKGKRKPRGSTKMRRQPCAIEPDNPIPDAYTVEQTALYLTALLPDDAAEAQAVLARCGELHPRLRQPRRPVD